MHTHKHTCGSTHDHALSQINSHIFTHVASACRKKKLNKYTHTRVSVYILAHRDTEREN